MKKLVLVKSGGQGGSGKAGGPGAGEAVYIGVDVSRTKWRLQAVAARSREASTRASTRASMGASTGRSSDSAELQICQDQVGQLGTTSPSASPTRLPLGVIYMG